MKAKRIAAKTKKTYEDPEITYQLPPGMIFALQSGRHELMNPFIDQVHNGVFKIDLKLQVEILRLVKGLIKDNIEAGMKLRRAESSLRSHQEAIADARDTGGGVELALLRELELHIRAFHSRTYESILGRLDKLRGRSTP